MVFKQTASFTAGKTAKHNEDRFAITPYLIVLADGATDKAGIMYGSKTGGEIAAEAVVRAALSTDLNGHDLVTEASALLCKQYEIYNPGAINSSKTRAGSTMAVVRVTSSKLLITTVGDSYVRINQSRVIGGEKLIDLENAMTRKNYIDRTGDVAGGRSVIQERLNMQHEYQNQPGKYGYGVIDGTPIPAEFVHYEEIPLETIKTLEVVSDGYYGRFPTSEPTIAWYEADHDLIEEEDPNKCKLVLSTKAKDDRTVIIVKL